MFLKQIDYSRKRTRNAPIKVDRRRLTARACYVTGFAPTTLTAMKKRGGVPNSATVKQE
jgi:hypothetical protein